MPANVYHSDNTISNTVNCIENVIMPNNVLVSEDAYVRNGSSVNNNNGE